MEEQKIKTQKYKDGNIYREDNGYRWQKYLGKDDKGKNKYKKFRAQTMHELKDKVNRYNGCFRHVLIKTGEQETVGNIKHFFAVNYGFLYFAGK